MTIKCPYTRLRVAASLAPLPGHEASCFALTFLRNAVKEFADRPVDVCHSNLLELAREITSEGATEERWRSIAAELVTVNHERRHGDQWYQRGPMA